MDIHLLRLNEGAILKMICLQVTLILIASRLSAQVSNYNTEKDIWYDGVVQLSSGNYLQGKLNYNFVTDQLTLRYDEQTQTFYTGNVRFFRFTDDQGEVHTFYSLEYRPGKKELPQRTYFELIYDNERLAVLSRVDFTYKERRHSPSSFGQSGIGVSANIITQIERVDRAIYLADRKGGISHFLSCKLDKITEYNFNIGFNEEHDKLDYLKARPESNALKEPEKYRYVNKNILKDLTGKDWSQLKAYIKKNDLNIKRLQDLITLLEFHKSL